MSPLSRASNLLFFEVFAFFAVVLALLDGTRKLLGDHVIQPLEGTAKSAAWRYTCMDHVITLAMSPVCGYAHRFGALKHSKR